MAAEIDYHKKEKLPEHLDLFLFDFLLQLSFTR